MTFIAIFVISLREEAPAIAIISELKGEGDGGLDLAGERGACK
jgi:hypothetical protein